MENYVVDTSVVIERIISKLVKKGEIKGKIIVPQAVISELENQANKGHEIGFIGLEELQELRKFKEITIEFTGERPNETQIKFAKSGEIDAIIREIAFRNKAVLITADKVQAESAKAFGIKVKYLKLKEPREKLEIERFFDEKTMSVHLKENCFPFAKKGKPGEWELVKIKNKKLSSENIQEIAKEVVEKSRIDPETFIEISRRGSTIVQYKNYRIVIVKPPISDGWEITAVKPLKRFDIEYYNLELDLLKRVKEKSRGILIAGEAGAGKSTFVQALGELYLSLGKIVKTIESPRDLQLPDDITQYSKNFASSEEIHDILFLSRPDNIIFDEMRDTPDFKLYADLRLGGSECIGVIHSASPIDAVQRFIGRLDVGVIPSVLDTILFIEKGKVGKVHSLKMIVKVPSGMTESDLARPIIEVRNFENKRLEYEIYSYGEETVVIPVENAKKTGATELATKSMERELKKYCNKVEVDIISDNKAVIYVPETDIPKIIGKKGFVINKIEKDLGMSIEVKELKEEKGEIKFKVAENKNQIRFFVDKKGKAIDFYLDDEFLFSATSGKKGEIKVNKKSKLGRVIVNALNENREIKLKS